MVAHTYSRRVAHLLPWIDANFGAPVTRNNRPAASLLYELSDLDLGLELCLLPALAKTTSSIFAL